MKRNSRYLKLKKQRKVIAKLINKFGLSGNVVIGHSSSKFTFPSIEDFTNITFTVTQ